MAEENLAANTGAVDVAAPVTPATSSTSSAEGQTVQTQQTTQASLTQEPTAQTDVTQTQAFAHRLAAEKQKAVDAEYDRLYGADYNIHSKAEYDNAIAAQQQAERDAKIQQSGGDPAVLKEYYEELKRNDPDFKAMKQEREDSRLLSEYNGLLSSLEKSGIKDAVKAPNDIQQEVWGKWNKGKSGLSLADAYFLVNKEQILSKSTASAQQNAVNQMLNNGQSSPGSLSSGVEADKIFTPDQVKGMSKEEVHKNFDAIERSMKTWR